MLCLRVQLSYDPFVREGLPLSTLHCLHLNLLALPTSLLVLHQFSQCSEIVIGELSTFEQDANVNFFKMIQLATSSLILSVPASIR